MGVLKGGLGSVILPVIEVYGSNVGVLDTVGHLIAASVGLVTVNGHCSDIRD